LVKEEKSVKTNWRRKKTIEAEASAAWVERMTKNWRVKT
jgi:hypothetical protein